MTNQLITLGTRVKVPADRNNNIAKVSKISEFCVPTRVRIDYSDTTGRFCSEWWDVDQLVVVA